MKKFLLTIVILCAVELIGVTETQAIGCFLWEPDPVSGPSGTSAMIHWRVAGEGDVSGDIDFGNNESDSDSGFKNAGRDISTTYNGSGGGRTIVLTGDEENGICGPVTKTFTVTGSSGGGSKQCSDGQDNDGDLFIDYPNDAGCTDANDDSEIGGTNPNAYVNLDINTQPEGMNWQLYCPGGNYSCNFAQGTGDQFITNPNTICTNNACAGAGTYQIIGKTNQTNYNPGYNCTGNTDFRPGTPGTQTLSLFLDCTPITTPTPTASATPTPTPTPLVNNAVCVSHTIPSVMTAGETRAVSMTFRNTGTSTWTQLVPENYDVSLAPWPPSNPSLLPSSMDIASSPVLPNGTTTMNFNLTAPAAAGSYLGQFRLLQQGLEWFGGMCGPATVTVNLPPPTVTITANPAAVAYGGSSVISWSSTNAAGCVSTNGNAAWPMLFRPTLGSVTAGPLSASATFTLTCTGSGGTAVGNTTVSVAAPPPPSVLIQSVAQPNYCTASPAATVNWLYSDPIGFPQGKYQMQISSNSLFTGIPVFDSTIRDGSNSSTGTGMPSALVYASTYWARVKVWDSLGTPSAWSSSFLFSTPSGAYPQPVITYTPANPPANAPIQFTGSATNNPLLWFWTFSDGTTALSQNPTHAFTTEGPASAMLTVTNVNGVCTVTRNINVSKPVPGYREIRPGL